MSPPLWIVRRLTASHHRQRLQGAFRGACATSPDFRLGESHRTNARGQIGNEEANAFGSRLDRWGLRATLYTFFFAQAVNSVFRLLAERNVHVVSSSRRTGRS